MAFLLTGLLVFLHPVGAAIVVGTWIHTVKRPTVSPDSSTRRR